MKSEFEESVLQFVKKHFFELNNKKIIIGLSGGVDSVGLLLWLNNISLDYKLELKAVHINHLIRENANSDEEFCRNLCLQLGIEFVSHSYDIPTLSANNNLSEEEMGRIVRRQTFEKELKDNRYDYIFLAHHIEDRCETIIHNIVRGTGLDGLSGIIFQNGEYIRPLLNKTKEEIIKYVQDSGYSWVEDDTNTDTAYTRNYIRMEILPRLQSINPKAIEHICSMGDIAYNAKQTLEGKTKDYYTKQIIRTKLRKLNGSIKDITNTHITEISKLLDNNVGKKITLPYNIVATRTYDDIEFSLGSNKVYLYDNTEKDSNDIVLCEDTENISEYFETQIINLDDNIENDQSLYNECISNRRYTKYFDYDIIKGDLDFRFRQNGDYISLITNHKSKLKDYLIDSKVDAELRDKIPLVAIGQEILWIVGFRSNINYYVSPKTRNIIKITYINKKGK